MRQYAGNLVFALLAVVVTVIGAATHWPWAWQAWTAVAGLFLLGAILTRPAKPDPPPEPRSSFIAGDADGSSIGNAYTEADDFVSGNARHALIWNIIHRPQQARRR